MQNKLDKPIGEVDPLKEYLKGKKQEALSYISHAAKLVAPFIASFRKCLEDSITVTGKYLNNKNN